MGYIYNGVCSSLVALFLWQQVTHLASVIAYCGISPNRYGSLSKCDLFPNSLFLPPSLSLEFLFFQLTVEVNTESSYIILHSYGQCLKWTETSAGPPFKVHIFKPIFYKMCLY